MNSLTLSLRTVFIALGVCILAGLFLTGEAYSREAERANNDLTLFTIEIPKKADYSIFTLTNPNRIVVDLPEMPLRIPSLSERKKSGLIRDVKYALIIKGKARLVIETTVPTKVAKSSISQDSKKEWARIELGLARNDPISRTLNMGSKRSANLIVPPKPVRVHPPSEFSLPLIVIDPGHGGYDTGAIKHGVREKNVVLAFAKHLKERLENTKRYRVKLTREDDRFIPLKKRAAFARKQKADLFLSIHADYSSSRQSSVRGATFYSLSGKTAKRLANRSKRSMKVADLIPTSATSQTDSMKFEPAVRNILMDLGRRWVQHNNGRTSSQRRPTPPVPPPSQDMPVLQRCIAEDRLQGRAPDGTLCVRTRQNRTEPHYGRISQETARTRESHQTGTLSGSAALCHRLKQRFDRGAVLHRFAPEPMLG